MQACSDGVAAGDIEAPALYGSWNATFTEGAPPETLRLGPHPDYDGSLRGDVLRVAARIVLAGDIDDGEVTLEESDNGRNITATWIGRVADRSCGQRIEGTWNDARTAATRHFVLQKTAGPAPAAPTAAPLSR